MRVSLVEFQFHYGTIKSDLPGGVVADIARFNSTMVRLKAPAGPRCPTSSIVSIPLWYD